MRRTYHMTGHTIGMTHEEGALVPSNNHFKESSLTPKLASAIAEAGLTRLAGNIFLCRSQKDFWKVEGGKIRRITVTEVDNGDEMPSAPTADPSNFLQHALSDLTF